VKNLELKFSPAMWIEGVERDARWVVRESAINGFSPQSVRIADIEVNGRKGRVKLTVEFED
jgi:hypothetical protein